MPVWFLVRLKLGSSLSWKVWNFWWWFTEPCWVSWTLPFPDHVSLFTGLSAEPCKAPDAGNVGSVCWSQEGVCICQYSVKKYSLMCSPRLVLGQCTQHSGFFSVLPAPTPYFIAYYVTEKGIRLKFRAHGWRGNGRRPKSTRKGACLSPDQW